MTAILILASLVPGQYRSCQTAASYRQVYAAPVYQRQVYASSYAAYAQPYVAPYLEVRFAPVIHEQYAGLVGGEARARNRREQELQSRAELAVRVDKLAASIDGLSARISTVSSPPPVAPAKPTPQPETPSLPPVPKVNPDNGDVPPPPPVPGTPPATGAIEPPDAAVLAILTSQCAKCHTAPAKAGKGVILFTEPGKLANLGPLDLLLIDQQTYSGAMPKNADPVSADDYSKLRAWINGSQDEIEAALRACKTKP